MTGQCDACDASYHGKTNPMINTYWIDAVQNEEGSNNKGWVPLGSTDPLRDITETIFAATEADLNVLQLLPPFTRTTPGPLLQAARARAKAEGWWPLGPAPSTKAGGKRQRAAYDCMSGARPTAEVMMLPDDPELVCMGPSTLPYLKPRTRVMLTRLFACAAHSRDGRLCSITTRKTASGRHFTGPIARPRSSRVPSHCRSSKASTRSRRRPMRQRRPVRP